MANQGKKSSLVPLLAGAGLIGGGLYLWLKSSNSRPQIDEQLIPILVGKWQNADEYLDLVYAEGRIPTTQEMNIYSAMIEDMALEEHQLTPGSGEADAAEAAEAFSRNIYHLGLYVVLPIAGMIAAAVFASWWKNKRPPTQPPTCPKDGQQFSSPEALQHHVEQDHEANQSSEAVVEVQNIINSQPFFVTQTIAVASGGYQRTYDPWISFSPSEWLSHVGGALFVSATGVGTVAITTQMARLAVVALI
jgi:hypothetical protein